MSLENNVLLTIDGSEVYKNDIDIMIDEYIETLPDSDLLYKSSPFKGLLLYIYNQKLKYIIEMDKQNNNSKNNNYNLLNDIFYNIYLPLVYRYNLIPTILEFSVFVNIDNSHLTDVRNGFYRGNGSKANPENTRIVKSWFNVCESALASKAFSENGIGAIFGLKSAHGWVEGKQQIEIVNNLGAQLTPQQIAEKYADIVKPVLAEND